MSARLLSHKQPINFTEGFAEGEMSELRSGKGVKGRTVVPNMSAFLFALKEDG